MNFHLEIKEYANAKDPEGTAWFSVMGLPLRRPGRSPPSSASADAALDRAVELFPALDAFFASKTGAGEGFARLAEILQAGKAE